MKLIMEKLSFFSGKCNFLFTLFVFFMCTSYAQNFTVADNDNCNGNPISGTNTISFTEPCIQYNYELPFDLVWSDDFNGTGLDLNNWQGLIDVHSYYYNVITNTGIDRPQKVDYAWSYLDDLNNTDKHFLFNSGNITLKTTDHAAGPIYKNVLDNNPCASITDPSDPRYGLSLEDCPLAEDGFPNNRAFNYSSGALLSRRKFKYGYFEAMIKLPPIDGVWPGFWLAPTKTSPGTEIDIYEFNQLAYLPNQLNGNPSLLGSTNESIESANKKMYMTYHDWTGGDKCYSATATPVDFSFVNEWHRYGLYWDEYKLVWSIDGNEAKTIYRYFYEYYDIHHPFQLTQVNITNCHEFQDAIDENYTIKENNGYPVEYCVLVIDNPVKNFGLLYNPDPAQSQACGSVTATFPSMLEIDWVRVWSRRQCETEYYECNTEDLPSNIAANNIALGKLNPFSSEDCHVLVKNADAASADAYWAQVYHNGQTVDAVASENVRLLPGFQVQKGAEFRARIEPCYGADLRSSSGPSNEHIYALLDEVEKKRIKKPVQDSLKTENEISVYPNPSTGIFTLKYPESMNTNEFSIRVYDNSGRTVFNQNSFTHQLDLSSFARGIYHAEVYSGIQTFRIKLIRH